MKQQETIYNVLIIDDEIEGRSAINKAINNTELKIDIRECENRTTGLLPFKRY